MKNNEVAEPVAPIEENCRICGFDTPIWFTDNALWSAYGKFGILCVKCFTRAAEDAGFKCTGWKLIPEVAEPVAEDRTAAIWKSGGCKDYTVGNLTFAVWDEHGNLVKLSESAAQAMAFAYAGQSAAPELKGQEDMCECGHEREAHFEFGCGCETERDVSCECKKFVMVEPVPSPAQPEFEDVFETITARNLKLEKALFSIANNTCCESCQEARLVAREALGRLAQPEETTKK